MRADQIAGRRVRNSRLTKSEFVGPDQVVRWHGAMQAQDYGPAKWSIGQRATGLVDADVDEALASGLIVRTHVLRPTWHFVARDDVRRLIALTGPRVQQHTAPRYRQLGLDAKTRARCERTIASGLEGGNQMTRNEIGAVLARARIDASGQRLPHVLLHCELEAVICSGGLRGKQQTFALFDDRVPPNDRAFDREDALVELARRYLKSHGPATEQDLRWWSSLTIADIRRALHHLGDQVRSESIEGLTFWSSAGEPARPPGSRGVHLLQVYDELLVGYTQSRFFGDPGAPVAQAARSDRRLPSGVVLSNGKVAGRWRRTIEPRGVKIEVHLHESLESPSARELDRAVRRLGRFVGRPAELLPRVVRAKHPIKMRSR